MLHLMKSEFIKLRTLRSTLTATIVLIIFPVAVTVLSAMFAKNPDETMVIKVLVNTGIVSLLLCGVLGVFAIAQEYSQGTIRITFAATPMRMKVFVAKALVISLWVAVSVAVLEGVGLIGANYALHSRGFDFGVIYNPSILTITVVTAILHGRCCLLSVPYAFCLLLWGLHSEPFCAVLLGQLPRSFLCRYWWKEL
jgi:ABC-type transport system involved in multi-copper enzyme maturation permease subunit